MNKAHKIMLDAMIGISDFIEQQVGYDMSNDNDEFLAPIVALRSAITYATMTMHGTLFLIVHKHKYGEDVYACQADRQPSVDEVIHLYGIDFEPMAGETIDVHEFTAAHIPYFYFADGAEKAVAKAAALGCKIGVSVPVVDDQRTDYIERLTDRFGYPLSGKGDFPEAAISAMYGEITFCAQNKLSGKYGILVETEYMTLSSDEIESEEFIRSLYGEDCPEPTNEAVIRYLEPQARAIYTKFDCTNVSFDVNGILGRVELRVFVPLDTVNLKQTVENVARMMLDNGNLYRS